VSRVPQAAVPPNDRVNVARPTNKHLELKHAAEQDLETFIRLVHPQRVLPAFQLELMRWWERKDAGKYQLVLLPRDHGKSALMAYRAVWRLTKDPSIRILYISSTANLATKQLSFIKGILTSPRYRLYWPEMVNEDEGKREKWTESEISVDHPRRRDEAIRDPSIFTAGLTTSITGLHCDIAALDDVVVKENAYTEEGREKTRQQYSLLSSIEAGEAEEWVVGTRYHPLDLYNDMQGMTVAEYDEEGALQQHRSLYETHERQVEDVGDGSGQFLWPKQRRYDGKWFGFDRPILEEKRAKYLDKIQFRAQYYNDPNDPTGGGINRDCFQYYDAKHVTRVDGRWYIKGRRLNVFAAMGFAYALSKRSDYTAIVVVGIDSGRNYYVLDIDRFKTNQVDEYFHHILNLHRKWDFRQITCETTAAQDIIVQALKNDYIRPHGLALSVKDYKPHKGEGVKEERITATLGPKYRERQIWHYFGGHCSTLEEELLLANPPHDDLKDCLTIAVNSAVPPSFGMPSVLANTTNVVHHRFGGIA
jgi:hypothetical protein